MLTFTWGKLLEGRHRHVPSCDQLNFDLVASTVVIYMAGKVTVGVCDPSAAVHFNILTTVTENRKHTSHQMEGVTLIDDKR